MILQSNPSKAMAPATHADVATKTVRLVLRSNPSGATVFEANREIGMTPLRLSLTHAEPRLFRLLKRGYKDRIVLLDGNKFFSTVKEEHPNTKTAEPQAEWVVKLVPESSSALVVTSDPAGAEVFIGGVRVGVTPLTHRGIQSGEHSVRLVLKEYFPQESKVLLKPGQEKKLHIALQNKTETLYRELIDKEPKVLAHYEDLSRYYLMKGEARKAIAVIKDGFAVSKHSTVEEVDHYCQILADTYTRAFTYPAPSNADEALLRKTIRDILEHVKKKTTGQKWMKWMRTYLSDIAKYDRYHPLPRKYR